MTTPSRADGGGDTGHVDVCHVSTTFNRGSGSARRTLAIAEHCHRHGLRTLLAYGPDNDMEGYDGPVERVVLPSLGKRPDAVRDVRAWREIRACLRRARPRIVHTHLAKAGILGRLVAGTARSSRPLVLHTVHGPTFDPSLNPVVRAIYRGLERLAARRTDMLIYVGEDLRRAYLDAGIRARLADEVIRTGRTIDLSTPCRHHGAEASRPLRLVYVARIVPMKQHTHALTLLERLKAAGIDATLDFVGEALVRAEQDYRGELERRVSEAGLEGRVRFTGHVSNVHERLARADVALLVSKYEGLPNAAVESLLAGTPIVAYDVSGVREVLGAELADLVVPQNDVEGLFTAVEALLARRPEIEERVRGRRHELARTYGMERMTSTKLDLYRRLLESDRGIAAH